MAERRRPGLNADLGEGFTRDDALLGSLDRASIACGGHAGSAASMRRAVRDAVRRGVAVGAHVSYPDRRRFGRVSVPMQVRHLEAALFAQARALSRITSRRGVPLDHVKPHGALYHDATRHRSIALTVGRVIRRLGPGVAWIGEAHGWPARVARRYRIPFLREGFADRRYDVDGRLVPRSAPGAILRGRAAVARQVRRLCRAGGIDTLCIHSDTPGCVAVARAARRVLGRPG